MRNYPNIDPSAFHKGEYVGYADGVWRIAKSTSSLGNWHARKVDDANRQLFAFGLAALSAKLESAARKTA